MAQPGASPPSDQQLAEAGAFQRDLYLYWRAAHAAAMGLPLTARSFLTRQALRRVAAPLAAAAGLSTEPPAAEPEDRRLYFVRRLLERLGLLRRANDGRLLAAPPAEIERYLAHPLAERLRICARLWVAGGWWPEQPDPRAPPPRPLVPAPPRIALARRRLLDTLAEAAPGATLSLPPDVRPAPPRAPHTRRRQSTSRPLADRAGEGAIQRAALLGPLRWLGLVALDEAAGRVTVCAACLALRAVVSADALPEPRGALAVLSNLTAIAYPPLAAPALLLLDSCAELDALDQTARYRLTRAGLARSGLSAGRLVARLESLTAGSLPQNVRATLDDWTRHAARLRLTLDATVLKVRAPSLLDALLVEPSAPAWVMRRLTPTAALLAPDAVAAVRAWLLRRGELPALGDGGDSDD